MRFSKSDRVSLAPINDRISSKGPNSMRAETGTKTVDTTELLNALVAFKNGDFSVRLPTDRTGDGGKGYDALNEIFGQNEHMAQEFARIGNAVGKEGTVAQRAGELAAGVCAACVEAGHRFSSDIERQPREDTRALVAVGTGDLT